MDNHVILTGAGFTHNFGTPLASRMGETVLNFIEDNEVKAIFRKQDFDYESAYQLILDGSKFTDEQKKSLSNAVKSAYITEIDDVILDTGNQLSHTIHLMENNLFTRLESPFFIFTLNQDLFIERKFINSHIYSLERPASKGRYNTPNYNNPLSDLFVNNSFSGREQELEELKKDFNKQIMKIREGRNKKKLIAYIKLHGSMDWVADGEEQLMVIGGNKERHIEKYPLLKWYYEIFKEEINKDSTKLLIIGYGFTDKHINQVLKKSIVDNNLKLFIINPVERSKFEENFSKEDGSIFIKAIDKYYPYDLKTLFPTNRDSNISSHWIRIAREYGIGH